MNYFDANSWIGRWPFAWLDAPTPRSLATHLRRHGIARALVSPIEAVLAPAPGPANRELLRSTRGVDSIAPVPVVNPALANWREELDAAADPRVRAVRVLPNYHNFRLRSRAMDEFAAELVRRRLRLIVQMRLVDERHEFHAMRLKGAPAGDLDALLRRQPRLRVLACGLTRPELCSLAAKHPRLLADLSFVEWHDTVRHVLAKVPSRQLAFGSLTPFFVTAASKAKVSAAGIGAKTTAAIASGNLAQFLSA